MLRKNIYDLLIKMNLTAEGKVKDLLCTPCVLDPSSWLLNFIRRETVILDNLVGILKIANEIDDDAV